MVHLWDVANNAQTEWKGKGSLSLSLCIISHIQQVYHFHIAGKKSTDLVLNRCYDNTNLNPTCSPPYSLALTKQQ